MFKTKMKVMLKVDFYQSINLKYLSYASHPRGREI